MSEQDPTQKRQFEPIEDPVVAHNFLKEGAKTTASALVWSRNQEHVIHTHLTLYSDVEKLLYLWIPKDFDARKFMDDLARMNEKECFFSLSLTRANIFFKAEFAGFDFGGLKFKLPPVVFKVQRRKNMRFPIPDGHVLKITFEDPIFPESTMTKKALDISAGGLAILVADHETSFFPVGRNIKNVNFRFGGRDVVCDAEVRHVKEQMSDIRHPGYKVGLLFKNIKAADSQHIASLVFEETRKFFMKFF